MQCPYLDKLDKRFLVYKTKSLYLNHCTATEFKKVFGDFTSLTFKNEEFTQFTIENDLGEMSIIFDSVSGLLIYISLELYEDIALPEFLTRYGYEKYAYFEFLGNNYLAFNQNLAVRLSLKTKLVVSLSFANSNYVQKAETEFFEAMKKALENMEVENAGAPKVICLTVQ
ncbi:MAG: hypothetical protein WC460_04255 [Patescibacteria group bacterium]